MSDPWADLRPPSAANKLNARRVDAASRWSFFWARSVDDRCLFVIEHDIESSPAGRLPRLQGIEVTHPDGPDGASRLLVFKLHDSLHRDLFYRLCQDILSCTVVAATEKEMVQVALSRTWRWHHLLRGGSDGRLTPEAQKGLIGELQVLERHLLRVLSARDAVMAWTGPLGAPKDFAVGQVGIEVKSRRGGTAPCVKINSETQLDDTGLVALFLIVTHHDRAPVDSGEGATLTDVVNRVRTTVHQLDVGMLERFENLLIAAGFRWADDYSDARWLEGPVNAFRVSAGFPRLAAPDIPAGVSAVSYTISMNECNAFSVDVKVLEQTIGGSSDSVG